MASIALVHFGGGLFGAPTPSAEPDAPGPLMRAASLASFWIPVIALTIAFWLAWGGHEDLRAMGRVGTILLGGATGTDGLRGPPSAARRSVVRTSLAAAVFGCAALVAGHALIDRALGPRPDGTNPAATPRTPVALAKAAWTVILAGTMGGLVRWSMSRALRARPRASSETRTPGPSGGRGVDSRGPDATGKEGTP